MVAMVSLVESVSGSVNGIDTAGAPSLGLLSPGGARAEDKWAGGARAVKGQGLSREPGLAHEHSLAAAASCCGVGLHSGRPVTLTLIPAPPGHGILFRRQDVGQDRGLVAALWHNVLDTRYCTMIGNEHGVTVATIEHLMAALAGAGVDNLLIEIDGPEVPIMDGSAAAFSRLIARAGIVEQPRVRSAVRIRRPVRVSGAGGSQAAILPHDHWRVDVEIDFEDPAILRQRYELPVTRERFESEISPARTFGFLHEVEQLRAAGLIQGGALDNAIVVSEGRVLNEGGLRYPDEFARHKALDCVGDLYLAGAPLLGRFTGNRPGHGVNNALLRAVFADSRNWELAPVPKPETRPWRRASFSHGAEGLLASA